MDVVDTRKVPTHERTGIEIERADQRKGLSERFVGRMHRYTDGLPGSARRIEFGFDRTSTCPVLRTRGTARD